MSSDDSYYDDDGYDYQSEGSMYDEPDYYDNDGAASENDDGSGDEHSNIDDDMQHDDDDDAQESDMCEDQEEIEECTDDASGEESASDEQISEEGDEEEYDEDMVEESGGDAGSENNEKVWVGDESGEEGGSDVQNNEEVCGDESGEEEESDEQLSEEEYDDGSDEEYFDNGNNRVGYTDYSDSDEYYAPQNNTAYDPHHTTSVLLPAGNFINLGYPVLKCTCTGKCRFLYEMINVSRYQSEFTSISNEMKLTIRNHQLQENGGGKFSSYDIISIQRLKNNCLWRRFIENKIKIECNNEKFLFHGTTASNTNNIIRSGFNKEYAKPNGMFGTGIYFAEHSSKSNQYVYGFLGGNGCPRHQDKSCYVCHRQMLLCRVSLGKVYELRQADHSMSQPPPSYDSVKGVPIPGGGGLVYPEYAVYDADQIYPEFVITYKIRYGI